MANPESHWTDDVARDVEREGLKLYHHWEADLKPFEAFPKRFCHGAAVSGPFDRRFPVGQWTCFAIPPFLVVRLVGSQRHDPQCEGFDQDVVRGCRHREEGLQLRRGERDMSPKTSNANVSPSGGDTETGNEEPALSQRFVVSYEFE